MRCVVNFPNWAEFPLQTFCLRELEKLCVKLFFFLNVACMPDDNLFILLLIVCFYCSGRRASCAAYYSTSSGS